MAALLDIEHHVALVDYLTATGRTAMGEVLGCRTLAGGVSSRTVLVTRQPGPDWVLKQALPKLRVEMDWFSDPLRVHREAAGLRALERRLPPGCVPRFVFEDFEQHLFAMHAVPAPHENWKQQLLAGVVSAELVRQFAELLGNMHRASWLARDELAAEFADRSFFETLRIEPYYECTAGLVAEAAGFLLQLVATTRARSLALVHGDFSPKNILVHEGRLVLLDHEVIHFGDPAFDVGFAATHLLSKAHHVVHRREAFREAAGNFWNCYHESLGTTMPWADDLESHAVRHTLGCLLARVAGRSPLEYLTGAQRARQRCAVLALMDDPPASMSQLADAFLNRLGSATT